MESRNHYINRELSWLKFNQRVLDEADSPTVPLFERMRFLSIFISNLDEFFMVRAGSLYDRSLLPDTPPDNKTGMTVSEQLDAMYAAAHRLYERKDAYAERVEAEMTEHGIQRLDFSTLSDEQNKAMRRYFRHEILPLLSAVEVDTSHKFPHLENRRLYLAVCIRRSGESVHSIVPVSDVLDRLIVIDRGVGVLRYALIEDFLLRYADEIYKPAEVVSRCIIRITRNADVTVADNFADEDVNYLNYVEGIIRGRDKLAPMRIEAYAPGYGKGRKLLEFFMNRLGLREEKCYHTRTPSDMSWLSGLEDLIRETGGFPDGLFYRPLSPRTLPLEDSVTAVSRRRDILLSYPYYSMQTYLDLLEEAAADPDTESIRITLYRMANHSEVVRLLCQAAENGKRVDVLVELKARFDESNNVGWSRRLEEAGCHVLYGVEGLKVHSKITLITRRIEGRGRYTVHIGTGNYNEKTARLYTDLGLITTDPRITADAVMFFENILASRTTDAYGSLLIAPEGLKEGISAEIRREAEKGRDGYICMKMNGMTDKELIDELAEASSRGVKIDLIIRGICCLLPGLPGDTDNIRVISIVGRLLEHSRIYIFGRSEQERRTYIGSSDLMTRNTSRRVEILTPVYDEGIAAEIYRMTRVQLTDNVKGSRLCSNGLYEHVITTASPLDSQMEFYREAYRLSGSPEPAV